MIESEDHDLLTVLLRELEARGLHDDPEATKAHIEAFIERLGVEAATLLQEFAVPVLAGLEAETRRFEEDLRAKWREPFYLLRMIRAACTELGSEISRAGPSEDDPADYRFQALTRLHARACQTSAEILVLLESGFTVGAEARWRTAHELTVVGVFLSQGDQDLAERYVLHQFIEMYWAYRHYNEHHVRAGLEPPESEEAERVIAKRESLLARFGREFGRSHGWAAEALGKASPTLYDLEEAVSMDHLRPWVGMAHQSVHAGPRALFFSPAVPGGHTRDKLLAGPSHTGLSGVGHAGALSLLQITSALVSLDPSLERVAIVEALKVICEEAGASLLRVEEAGAAAQGDATQR